MKVWLPTFKIYGKHPRGYTTLGQLYEQSPVQSALSVSGLWAHLLSNYIAIKLIKGIIDIGANNNKAAYHINNTDFKVVSETVDLGFHLQTL